MLHNLTKIKLFRVLLYLTYPISFIFLYPIALFKKKNKGNLFFFLDRYALGGAQRIHLDILQSIPDVYKEIYFTRRSLNDTFKIEFYATPNAYLKDIHFWCDNLIFRLFTVHYYSFYVNRHKHAHVFSSNSTFFYDMLPFIRKDIIKTELLHNFTYGKNGMEFFGLANCNLLNYRIVYDSLTLANIKKQYEEYGIDPALINRILYIEPGVKIADISGKSYQLPLKVLYAGRGSKQKRVHLLNEIAQKCIEQQINVEFHFAGNVIEELSAFVKERSVLHGQVSKSEDMYHIYLSCHVILMTSAYEGFPMLIKEGMANGCIPVVTALEGNKSHLQNESNSLLILEPENEGNIVPQGLQLIKKLVDNKDLLQSLSYNAHSYAKVHFNKESFIVQYHKLLHN